MWKRVNPNVEYVIAAMRKKGEDIIGSRNHEPSD